MEFASGLLLHSSTASAHYKESVNRPNIWELITKYNSPSFTRYQIEGWEYRTVEKTKFQT